MPSAPAMVWVVECRDVTVGRPPTRWQELRRHREQRWADEDVDAHREYATRFGNELEYRVTNS